MTLNCILLNNNLFEFMENNTIFIQLKNLMQVEPELRKPDQIQIIEDLLLNFPFFKRLKQDYHVNNVVDCAIYFNYKCFKSKESIFEAGIYASKFFVLLQGEVAIFKDDVMIRKYSEGPFEECCLSERRKYDVAAKAVQESHIIFVDHQIYAGIFMSIREKRRIAMASFLQMQKEFKDWSKAKLMSLSYFINELETEPATQVFGIGDPCDKIFIVQDGSVVVKSDKIQMFGVGDVIGIADLKFRQRRSVCVSHGFSTLLYMFKHDYIENLKKLPKMMNLRKNEFMATEKKKNLTISVHSFMPECNNSVVLHEIRRPKTGSSRPSSHNTHRTAYGSFFPQRNLNFQLRNTARSVFY